MRIVQQSSDLLVLRESPWTLRGMGAGLAALGGGILALIVLGGHGKEGNVWVGFVVGGMFAVVGLVMGLTAADRLVAFDRASKAVRLIRRGGVLRAQGAEYPFTAIRDIALESSPAIANGRTAGNIMYRIVLVMRDGSRVPWTNVSTADMGTLASCVAAARAFGGWDAAAARSGAANTEVARPTPPVGMSTVPPVSPPPMSFAPATGLVRATGMQNMGCAIALLSIFAVVGLGMVGVQFERLALWRAVPASVLSSEVVAVHGTKGGTSYRPSVTYAYQVDHRSYTSSSVTMITLSASWAWANGITQHYRPGVRTTAYVDPRDPTSAYLVHKMSFFPFIFVIVPLAFAEILLLSARWTARQTTLAAALPVPVVSAQPMAPSKAA